MITQEQIAACKESFAKYNCSKEINVMIDKLSLLYVKAEALKTTERTLLRNMPLLKVLEKMDILKREITRLVDLEEPAIEYETIETSPNVWAIVEK